MRRAGAAVVLVLAGCTHDLRVDLRSAQDRWELACGRRPEPSSVVVYPYSATVPCGATANAVGCTTHHEHDHRVDIAGAATDVPWAALMLHEMGHVLDADHLPTGGVGVMVPQISSANWRPCITRADLDAVVGGCLVYRPECS